MTSPEVTHFFRRAGHPVYGGQLKQHTNIGVLPVQSLSEAVQALVNLPDLSELAGKILPSIPFVLDVSRKEPHLSRAFLVPFLLVDAGKGVPSCNDIWVVPYDLGIQRDGLLGVALCVGHVGSTDEYLHVVRGFVLFPRRCLSSGLGSSRRRLSIL